MSVYLERRRDAASSGRRSRRRWRRATSSPAHEYVSKADALARFKQTFGDLAAAIDGARRQPAAGVVSRCACARRRRAQAGVDALGAQLRQMPGVADVRYDRQWLDRLLSAIDVVRGVGLVLGAGADDRRGADGRERRAAGAVRAARRDRNHAARRARRRSTSADRSSWKACCRAASARSSRWPRWRVVFFAVRARYLAPLASALNLSSVRFLPLELCAAAGRRAGWRSAAWAGWWRRAGEP